MALEQFDNDDLLSKTVFNEFVPVAFADNITEAEVYRALLEYRDIPTIIEDRFADEPELPVITRGLPVLVPNEMLDDASDILAGKDEPDDEQFEVHLESGPDDDDDGEDDYGLDQDDDQLEEDLEDEDSFQQEQDDQQEEDLY